MANTITDQERTLTHIAKVMAEQTSMTINEVIKQVNTPKIKYKAQYVLEELIKILQEKV